MPKAAVQSRPIDGAIRAAESRRPFCLFCAATFLSFLGTSSISYFSVVFTRYGMSVDEIGRIFSVALVPVVGGILFCGPLLTRFTSLQIAFTGQVVTLLGYASFLKTISDPTGAMLSRFAVGAGFGLFFPAALIYARSLVTGSNTVFLFGIYSTMIPLPNFIGPGLSEIIYSNWGVTSLLLCFATPIFIALVVMLLLPAPPAPVPSKENLGYGAIVLRNSVLLPNLAIAVVGLMWGFMLSFMALYLSSTKIPTAAFFTAATLSMVLSRFTVMAWLGKRPRHLTAGGGLLLMGLGYAVLPLCSSSVVLVATAAVIFGLGYSTVFPVLSLWATDQFEAAERGRAMAVFTAFFQGSIFVVPLVAGAMLRVMAFGHVLLALAAISTSAGLYIMSRRSAA
jgi:MFS family permease